MIMISARVGIGIVCLLTLPLRAQIPQLSYADSWTKLESPPPEGSDMWECAVRAGVSWRVGYDQGQLHAVPVDRFRSPQDPLPYEIDFADVIAPLPPRPPGSGPTAAQGEEWRRFYGRHQAGRVVVPTDDGWLIGFRAGEWGGSLWWYPRERGAGVKLSGRNVTAILAWPGRVERYVLFDVFPDFSDPVALRTPVRASTVATVAPDADGVWRITRRVDLQGGVEAYLRDGERVLMATARSLESLSSTGEVTVVANLSSDDSRWSPRPASIALGPAGEIALGMAFFVQRLVPEQAGRYQVEWLVPPRCMQFDTQQVPCACTGPG